MLQRDCVEDVHRSKSITILTVHSHLTRIVLFHARLERLKATHRSRVWVALSIFLAQTTSYKPIYFFPPVLYTKDVFDNIYTVAILQRLLD